MRQGGDLYDPTEEDWTLRLAIVRQALVDCVSECEMSRREPGPHRERHRTRAQEAVRFLVVDMWEDDLGLIPREHREALTRLAGELYRRERPAATWEKSLELLGSIVPGLNVVTSNRGAKAPKKERTNI